MIGILGGTFDPVHLGHIHFAKHAIVHLGLDEVKFLPCKTPVLKQQAHATTAQRLAMLELALADEAKMTIDKREIDRDTPSYMFETLQSLKADYPAETICLLMGMDAFADLPRWHQWQSLLDYCHIIVVARPHTPPTLRRELEELVNTVKANSVEQLSNNNWGNIMFMPIEEKDIASTVIRHDIEIGALSDNLLPETVLDYINKHGLYK